MKECIFLIDTEDLRRILDDNENMYYGRKYIDIFDHSYKFAVIDDDYQMPIILIHCYNYTEEDINKLNQYFKSILYLKLPSFNVNGKNVLMFFDLVKLVDYISDVKEEF